MNSTATRMGSGRSQQPAIPGRPTPSKILLQSSPIKWIIRPEAAGEKALKSFMGTDTVCPTPSRKLPYLASTAAHTMNHPSIHLVRCRCRKTGCDFVAAEEGFAPILPEDGPLHLSRTRFAVRLFPDADSAKRFALDYATQYPNRFETMTAEAVSPEFLAAILSMESDRAVLVQRLSRLVPGILDAFDFDRVAKAMAALDWKYAGEVATPTPHRLRQMAEGLLQGVVEDATGSEASSGGFRAWAFGEKLFLQFVIETAFAEPGRASRL